MLAEGLMNNTINIFTSLLSCSIELGTARAPGVVGWQSCGDGDLLRVGIILGNF